MKVKFDIPSFWSYIYRNKIGYVLHYRALRPAREAG